MSDQTVQQRKKFTKETPRDASQEKSQAQKQAIKALSKRTKKTSLVDYSYHIVFGGFVLLCVVAFTSTMFQDRRKLDVIPVIVTEKLDNHNQEEHSYRVGKNDMFADWTLADAKNIVKTQMTVRPTLPRCNTQDDSTIIPESYDFRTAHADCMKPVYNQGNCSSSYAIAAVGAFQDRLCQQSNGLEKPTLSAQAVVSCDSKRNQGCKSGSVSAALDFGKRDGYVEDNLLQYSGDWNVACPNTFGAAQRYYVSEYCISSTEEGIKREILKNGPVIAVVPVYRDFLVYKEGVYDVEEGASKISGGQAVKVIGWNKDDDQSYWIVENSWGQTWGLNGYAHVAIGQRSLYIDEFCVAPTPKTLQVAESKETETVSNQKQDESQPEEMDLDSKE